MKIEKHLMKKAVIVLLVLLLAAGGVMVIKKKKQALLHTPLPEKAPLPVLVVQPEAGTFPMTRRYLGTITAKVAADISPRITGRIFEVRVREGTEVKKGQLLALIDDRQIRDKINELRARLFAARSALNTQEGIFERDTRLFDNKAISREQLDRSRASRDLARAEVVSLKSALSSAETDLSYVRLKAPFDGIITKRYQDPGDLAVAGKPVLSMERPSSGYYVEVKVPQAEFPMMKKGNRVFLETEKIVPGQAGASLQVEISRVHPAVSTGTLAAVEVDTGRRPFGLPTGATVTARIETGTVHGLRVPLRALLENVDAAYVYAVGRDNKVHVKKVSLLYRGPDFAVIHQGDIPADSKVVVAQESALLRLHEGEKVKLVSGKEKI